MTWFYAPHDYFSRLSLVMFWRDSPQTRSEAFHLSGSYPQPRFVTFVTEYLRGTEYPPPT